jgi:hypothetical protein
MLGVCPEHLLGNSINRHFDATKRMRIGIPAKPATKRTSLEEHHGA